MVATRAQAPRHAQADATGAAGDENGFGRRIGHDEQVRGSVPPVQASALPEMTPRLVIRYHWRMVSASTPQVDSNTADRVSSLAQQIATKVHKVLGDETRVIWFGSWVKGQARPHSDIDLAIMASAPFPTGALARLRNWIDDLPTLYTIDLVNID